MKIMKQNLVLTTIFGILLASCVSNKKYTVLQKEKRRLDTSLDRANLEIKELREFRIGTEEQLRAKTIEAAKTKEDFVALQKSNDDLSKNCSVALEKLKKLSPSTINSDSTIVYLIKKLKKENLDLQFVLGQLSSKGNPSYTAKRRYKTVVVSSKKRKR